MNRRYVLDVFLPVFGLLECGAVFLEGKWGRSVLWGWVPAMAVIWLQAMRAATFVPIEGLVAFVLLLLYGLWWLVQGVRAPLRAQGLPVGWRAFWALYAAAVLAAFAATTGELTDHRPGAWMWPLGIALLSGGASAFRSSRRGGGILGALAPLVGVQGLPYFRRGRVREGMAALLFGWGLLTLYLWMVIGTALDPMWPTAEFTVMDVGLIWALSAAPFAYIGLWLWVDADSASMPEAPTSSLTDGDPGNG